jgi:hypothetical protein
VTWLDAAQVRSILGPKLPADLDGTALQACCDAARSYVEDRRADLWSTDDPPVYVPTPAVIHGAALYAYRLLYRRKSATATGIASSDPDVERLLGIGKARRFRFGGARVLDAEVV